MSASGTAEVLPSHHRRRLSYAVTLTGKGSVGIDQAVWQHLEGLGVPYEMLPCEPDFADTAAFCERYGYPPEQSANTILVASKRPPGRYAACVVLATTRLDVNRTVRDLLEVKKVSFASPEITREVTAMDIGGVTPFALPAGLPVFVDRRVTELEWIILGSGTRNSKIKAAPDILTRLPGVRVVDGLANPLPE